MKAYETTLDKFFLPDGDPRKFRGCVPSNALFCFKFAIELQNIHKQKLVHSAIKPSNIAISVSAQDHTVKLSDFGILEQHSSTVDDFQNVRYWIAPELINLIEDGNDRNLCLHATEESDIFSAGSVFFYSVSQGHHLFGDKVNEIVTNSEDGNRVNLFNQEIVECVPPMLLGVIRWMTERDPKIRLKLPEVIEELQLLQRMPENLQSIGDKISYSLRHVLGTGYQTNVLAGFFGNIPVAVKRISDVDLFSEKKKAIFYKERNSFKNIVHPNVVKLFGFAERGTFICLALEKCVTSLFSYCTKPLLYRDLIPMPSDAEVLFQLAVGLEYIHSQNILHRDVNPKNILISYDNPAVMKWTEFGMSETVFFEPKKGTECWMASELLTGEDKGSIQCDIFALGCVFFFFVVPGDHLFGKGSSFFVEENIYAGRRIRLESLSNQHFAYLEIKEMTEKQKEMRPKLAKVIDRLSLTIQHSNKVLENSTESQLEEKVSRK